MEPTNEVIYSKISYIVDYYMRERDFTIAQSHDYIRKTGIIGMLKDTSTLLYLKPTNLLIGAINSYYKSNKEGMLRYLSNID